MKPFNCNLMHKLLAYMACSIMVFAFVGCENDVYNPDKKKDGKTPHPSDFATTTSIQLNVKYNVPKGYQILFEVYIEDPYTTNEDGQTVKRADLNPVIIRMTDGNGAYNSTETITADHGNDVYIYTSYIGVPGLFKTAIKEKVINADINWGANSTATRQTRAADWTAPKGYNTLGTWNDNGRPNYLNEKILDLSAPMLKTINKTFAEGSTCPEHFRQDIDFVIEEAPEGRKAEVFVSYIDGKSTAASVFGYYCYTGDATKEKINAAKKYIIFPNTNTTDLKKPRALTTGECVKLHYINEQGEDKGTEFPSGTKIGWFLLNDAFQKGNKAYYSTTVMNSDNRTHTAAFTIDKLLVLSFEDWTDQDYNDVMFNVWSNPIEALNPDVPEVTPPVEEGGDETIAYRMPYKGIIAYEDNWPHKGDYDLNDVIVKYNSTLFFNTKNEVLYTEDAFTALWSGASYKNGFAYQLNTDRSNVTTELIESPTTFAGQGLDSELNKATINVFLSAREVTANNTKTPTYKIKNTFKVPVNHVAFGAAPYNPFIVVNDQLESSRCEVHLTNYSPTEKANNSLFHTGKDLSDPTKGSFYVAAESYPFAIHLSDAVGFSTTEGIAIDESYPDFAKWVSSGGKEHKDWYKKK